MNKGKKMRKGLLVMCVSLMMLFGVSTMVSAATPWVTNFTTLTQTGLTTNSVTVSWNQATNATHYEVDYKYSGTSGFVRFTTTKNLSATIPCNANSSIDVRVTARGTGSASNYSTISLYSCYTLPTQPKITKTYNYKYSKELSYYFESRTNVSGNIIKLYNYKTKKTQTVTGGRSYAAFAIAQNATYKITITPYTVVNGRQYSGTPLVKYFVPKVVLSKGSADRGYMNVKWNKVKGAKYKVYLKRPGGKWKVVKTTTKNSYKITGMKSNKTYKIKIKTTRKIAGKTRSATSDTYTAKIRTY